MLQATGAKWNSPSSRSGLLGGHCIWEDPYYLTQEAEMLGYGPLARGDSAEIPLPGRETIGAGVGLELKSN